MFRIFSSKEASSVAVVSLR